MKRLQEGDLSTRIHLNREDELQLIANNFNYMCERLELYINKVYISEITQKMQNSLLFNRRLIRIFI